MKAVTFHGIGDIRLEDVPEPKIEQPTDAVIRIKTLLYVEQTYILCEVPWEV